MRKRFLIIPVLIIALLIAKNSIVSTQDESAMGAPMPFTLGPINTSFLTMAPIHTFSPVFSFQPGLITMYPLALIADIPDANLKAALHDLTGIPPSDAITRNDLAALTGTIDLSGRSIVIAEGIQWCSGVHSIDLSENQLSALPDDLSMMTSLQTLDLSENQFIALPQPLYTLPGLESLMINKNQLTALPSDINMLSTIKRLMLASNEITALPPQIGQLSQLEQMDLFGNKLSSLPKELFDIPSLMLLSVVNNKLTELPDAVSSSSLVALYVNSNHLKKLPENIGNAPSLKALIANGNHIDEFPVSLCSNNVDHVILFANQISKLPAQLKNATFDSLYLDWNFIDVSPGSAERQILDGVTATGSKEYQNQLSPVRNLTATPFTDQIMLTWDAVFDGAEWSVNGYEVYDLGSSSSSPIQSLSKATTQYTHSSLSPDTEYRYGVTIEYTLALPMGTSVLRYQTEIETKTLQQQPTPTQMPSPTATPVDAPENSPEPSPSEPVTTAQPTPVPSTSSASVAQPGGPSIPIVLWVLFGAVALILVGVIVWIITLLRPSKTKK